MILKHSVIRLFVLIILNYHAISLSTSYTGANATVFVPAKEDCELIKIPFCKNLPYNQTSKLNLNGRINQNQVLNELTRYERLYKLNCSIFFESFICNYHLPLCTIRPLLPCYELCKRVKNDCLAILNQNNYDWPDELECRQFRTYEETRMCFLPRNFGQSSTITIAHRQKSH